MTDKFEIGEVAIYFRPESPYHGFEVVIASDLRPCGSLYDEPSGITMTPGSVSVYEITGLPYVDPLNRKTVVRPKHLRKKQQRLDRDIDRKVSWDECLWKPKQVTA